MSYETLAALCAFAFVTSITPGPSNLMLLASGANFGFARTLPQVLGITVGFVSLLLGMLFGAGALLAAFPALHTTLKIAGAAYLLYLAWRIAIARSPIGTSVDGARPLTLLESAAFQWINPKAWVVAASAAAAYASPDAPFVSVPLMCAAFALVNLPTVSAWAACGMALRRFLSDERRLKWFNLGLGALLAATLWPVLMQ